VLQLGAARADCLVLALTQQHADFLARESALPAGRGIHWGALPQALEGASATRLPLAVDHAVLQELVWACVREMDRLERRALAAEAQLTREDRV
jgi:hypothetical protein